MDHTAMAAHDVAFLPHGYCFLWNPGLLWLHVVSDAVTGLSYVAIAGTLLYLFYRARLLLPYSRVLVAFGLFIVACGTVHFIDIWTLWEPRYWLLGGAKAVTAIASIGTATALPFLIPRILRTLERAREADSSRAALASLVTASGDAIFGVAPGGTIVSWNAAAAQLYGYAPAEALGMPVTRLVPPADERESSDFVDALRLGARVSNTEMVHVRADGVRIEVALSIAPLHGESAVSIGTVVVARDVTERAVALRQLHQAQRMEAVGRLAGGIAHDFNNILTSIRVNAELLAEELPDDDRRREDVAEIVGGADRAMVLTRQLLAFGRRDLSRPEPVDLTAELQRRAKMLERLFGEEIGFVMLLPEHPLIMVMDPSQLEQIILNLTLNARDAMTSGGVVTIEAGIVDVPGARHGAPHLRDGRYVHLAVRDTGSGMTPHTREHLFEPFFTTKPHGRGTGLGLSAAYAIVQDAGGEITVESTLGAGSTFHVLLPLQDDVPVPRTATMDPVESSIPASVLLVDDESGVRLVAQRLLERHGYRVLPARHGADALEVMREHGDEIDVVLTDLVMPEMGGVELAAALARSHPGLPVIFMSGYTDDEIMRRGIARDEVSFLAKPFAAAALLAAVRAAMHPQRATLTSVVP